MRTKKIITISMFMIVIFGLNFMQASTSVYYVNAENGLYIRKSPSQRGEIVGLIPFGEKIKVISRFGEEFEIVVQSEYYPYIVKGNWANAQWKNITGWVYTGFLSDKKIVTEQINYNKFLKCIGQPLKKIKIHYQVTYSEIEQTYGKPQRIIKDQNTGAIKEFEFNDIIISVFDKGDDQFFISKLVISSNNIKICNVHIGIRQNEVITILGKPIQVLQGKWVYGNYSSIYGGEMKLILSFRDNIVNMIQVDY